MNRTDLSESFNKAAQTLEESTDSARKMLESLQQDGKLLIAPRKETMNYCTKTYRKEQANVMESFWVMLRTCELQADDENDPLLKHRVEGLCNLWNSLTGHDHKLAWIRRAENTNN